MGLVEEDTEWKRGINYRLTEKGEKILVDKSSKKP
jgi:predicted transcriptional regulator